MKENKLTDEDIVKALDCGCLAVVYGEYCEKCVLYDIESCHIVPDLIVDLIHRLQDEKKDMHQDLIQAEKYAEKLSIENARQKAEIERLTEENGYLDGCAKQFLADYQKCEIERAELEKQVDGLKIDLENWKKSAYGYKYAEEQAVKDTAKEIFSELYRELAEMKSCLDADYEPYYEALKRLEVLRLVRKKSKRTLRRGGGMMKNRAIQRGKPLDRDCYGCHTSTGEYGRNDDRVFCYGLEDRRTEEPLPKCQECGAYVYNAKPLKELQG